MRISIVDDIGDCRNLLQTYLLRYFEEQYGGDFPVIDEFESGEQLLSRFFPDAYHLIFLDHYMSGLSGIATAQKIRGVDSLVALVFVTTSREHAVESYGVRASGYLVKPFSYEDFKASMEQAGIEKIRSARFLQVQDKKILLRNILWCSRDGHYSQICTDSHGTLRFRLPFAELEEELLPYPQFLSCYKGSTVNLARVEQIGDMDSFLLDNGEKVLFSPRDRKKMETAYHAYLFLRAREDELL